MGLPNSSRETNFSGANGDREIFVSAVQLTTSMIGNLVTLHIHDCNIKYIGFEFLVWSVSTIGGG